MRKLARFSDQTREVKPPPVAIPTTRDEQLGETPAQRLERERREREAAKRVQQTLTRMGRRGR